MNNERYIFEHYLTETDQEIGTTLGLSSEQVRHIRRKNNWHKNRDVSLEEAIIKDREKKELHSKTVTLDKKYNELLRKTADLEKALEILHETKSISTYEIIPKKSDSSEATAVVLASDWHVGEYVDPATIGDVNSYNPDIARERAEQFFINLVKLLNICSRDIPINTLILGLLGDFITNTIHDDLKETNTLLPADELAFAQELITSGIEYLLQNTKTTIIIPCHSGNHGRMTQKQRVAAEAGNSLEYYMYRNIAMYFKDEPRLSFIIPKGYFSYVKVYDYLLRFSHGHHVSYGGGVGGITIPINKAIGQWNLTRKADIDCFGHFHQFLDGGYWVCNGTLMGFNSYAESIKARFDRPKQCFFLIDKLRGKTLTAPIVFDQ